MKDNKNRCYTYFKITGEFDPDEITKLLNLPPSHIWRIGDLRRDGAKYDFAAWEYGRCNDYDVYVENQMMSTINELIPKIPELRVIRAKYDVSFTLEIVPTIYVDEPTPCLAPNKEVIRFCYETDTAIDIDLYVHDNDEDESR